MPPAPLLSGYLLKKKRGSNSSLLGSKYQKRWFELTLDTLAYAKDAKGSKGSEGLFEIFRISEVQSVKRHEDDKLEIRFAERVLRLRAENREDLAKWCSAIDYACARKKSGKSRSQIDKAKVAPGDRKDMILLDKGSLSDKDMLTTAATISPSGSLRFLPSTFNLGGLASQSARDLNSLASSDMTSSSKVVVKNSGGRLLRPGSRSSAPVGAATAFSAQNGALSKQAPVPTRLGTPSLPKADPLDPILQEEMLPLQRRTISGDELIILADEVTSKGPTVGTSPLKPPLPSSKTEVPAKGSAPPTSTNRNPRLSSGERLVLDPEVDLSDLSALNVLMMSTAPASSMDGSPMWLEKEDDNWLADDWDSSEEEDGSRKKFSHRVTPHAMLSPRYRELLEQQEEEELEEEVALDPRQRDEEEMDKLLASAVVACMPLADPSLKSAVASSSPKPARHPSFKLPDGLYRAGSLRREEDSASGSDAEGRGRNSPLADKSRAVRGVF